MKTVTISLYSAAAIFIFFLYGCSSPGVKPAEFHFSFAVFGNTYPESPFVGFPDRIKNTVDAIKHENPLFAIHTGNIVHGGRSWMGITPEDMERQYFQARTNLEGLSPEIYTIAGEKDAYEGKPCFYKQNFRRSVNYSFTSSGVKFIVFNTVSELGDPESDLKWLKSELDISTEIAFIVIVTHNSIFNNDGVAGIYTEAEKFHELVREAPVKAVISGNPVQSRSFTLDSVQYYIAGTGGYTFSGAGSRLYQYYIFEVTNENINMTGARIP